MFCASISLGENLFRLWSPKIKMIPSEQQWIIVFDGRQLYKVKSKKTCIKIAVLALLLLVLPILVIFITYLVDPCFLLGKEGMMTFHVLFSLGNI